MVEQFEALLHDVIAEPNIKLNRLVEKPNEADRQQQIAKKKAYKDAIHQKLVNIERRSIRRQK